MGTETKRTTKIPRTTNVSEEELIRQIGMRPSLYGRSMKAGVRHIMWKEVSEAVGAPVEDCKKRWESLRGTYVKLYKGHLKRHKKWAYYDQMCFLATQLDNESSGGKETSSIEEDNDDYIEHTDVQSIEIEALSPEHDNDEQLLCNFDSHEQFLLSCAPILRRLSARKNSLARLKIQEALFEIEFS